MNLTEVLKALNSLKQWKKVYIQNYDFLATLLLGKTNYKKMNRQRIIINENIVTLALIEPSIGTGALALI